MAFDNEFEGGMGLSRRDLFHAVGGHEPMHSNANLPDLSHDVINVLIADWDDEMYDVAQEMQISHPDIRVVGVSPDCNAVFENLRHLHPEVVVAAYNLPGMNSIQFISRLVSQYPHIPVIVMINETEIENSGRIIHAGARDVIVKDTLTIDGLAEQIRKVYIDEIRRREAERAERMRREEVERAQRERRERRIVSEPQVDVVRQRQQVVAFYSPKGGVGRTVTLANVAVLLARKLARPDIREESRLKICVVDMDFGYGNLNTVFLVPNKTNIYDLIQTYDPNTGRFDQHALDKAIMRHPQVPGLDILLAPNRLEYHDAITGDHVRTLLRTLREREYDLILVDLTTDLRETTLEVLREAQKIFLFVEQDLSSIFLTEQVIDILTTTSLQIRRSTFRLVLSKVIQGTGVVPSDISEHLKMPIAASIPDERRLVTASINNGKLLALGPPNPVVHAYMRIAGMISPELALKGAPDVSESTSGGGLFSVFSFGRKKEVPEQERVKKRRPKARPGRNRSEKKK